MAMPEPSIVNDNVTIARCFLLNSSMIHRSFLNGSKVKFRKLVRFVSEITKCIASNCLDILVKCKKISCS